MHTINERLAELQKVEERFRQDLERFMRRRGDEIGDPSGCHVTNITFSQKKPHFIVMTADNKRVGFAIHLEGVELADNEIYQMRKRAKALCVEKGFKVHRNKMSSQHINAMREGDPEALNQWAHEHMGKALKVSSRYRDKLSSTILEPEDIANRAMEKTLSLVRKQGKERHINPSETLGWNILYETTNNQKRREMRKSDGNVSNGTIESYSWSRFVKDKKEDQHHNIRNILKEKLPDLLRETQEILNLRVPFKHSETKRAVLNAILENHNNHYTTNQESIPEEYPALSYDKIAERIAPEGKKPLSRESVSLALIRSGKPAIIPTMIRAAHDMADKDPDFEIIAEYLEDLLKTPPASRIRK